MAIHSPEYLKKRRKRLRRRAIISLSFLIILIGGLSYLSHQERFLIAEVKAEGNSVTSGEEIVAAAHQALEGKYMMLFPRASTFLYPRDTIRENLARDIPRLASVEPDVVDPRTLVVFVEEREPYALYCEDIVVLSDPTGCYFLDSDGLIFSEAPSFSGDVYFLYTTETTFDNPLGKRFMLSNDFHTLSGLLNALEELELGARALMWKEASNEYNLILPNSGKIVWKSDVGFNDVARNLEAFFLDEAVGDKEEFLDKVLYIDLRYANKIFFKLREE